ncbi:MAG: GNAT family N-acetyltransferase [Catenulispora sp.]|nr:GNAT family N-acetyltransferase [Catenulispora sp.]
MPNLEHLITRWAQGWQASRTLPPPETTKDALRIRCAQPGREFEIFALHGDEDPESLRRLATKVLAADESTWLTVTTASAATTGAALEAAGLQLVHPSETYMTIDLTRHPHHNLDPAFTSKINTEGADIKVEIHDSTGELAARGHLGLAGTDGVADRILTMPDFRRRGLGAVVMGMLATEAVARGAHTGLLVASEEGRLLYSRLGWKRVADVVIAQRPQQTQ